MLSQCIAEDDLLRSRKNKKDNRSRRKRAISSSQRETRLDYWSSTWGKLLVKLSAIPGGPLISSREGKLFRRRFRVPWDVFVDLLQKCKEKNYSVKTRFCSLIAAAALSARTLSSFLGYLGFWEEIGVAMMSRKLQEWVKQLSEELSLTSVEIL